MSGDVNLQDEPVIFYSEEMTNGKDGCFKTKRNKIKTLYKSYKENR